MATFGTHVAGCVHTAVGGWVCDPECPTGPYASTSEPRTFAGQVDALLFPSAPPHCVGCGHACGWHFPVTMECAHRGCQCSMYRREMMIYRGGL